MDINNNDYIDISVANNRSSIAIILVNILELEELEYFLEIEETIDVNMHRDMSIPVENVLYFTINNKNIKILDIVTTNTFPINHYFDFRILVGNAIQIDFKIKHNKNLKQYIYSLIIETINFIKYKNKYDRKISKSNIIKNFSVLLSENVSEESLKEIAYISEFINYDEGTTGIKKEFFNFSVDNIIFDIITNHDVIKFGYKKDDEEHFIYLPKDKIGTTTVANIVEKAIKLKNKAQ